MTRGAGVRPGPRGSFGINKNLLPAVWAGRCIAIIIIIDDARAIRYVTCVANEFDDARAHDAFFIHYLDGRLDEGEKTWWRLYVKTLCSKAEVLIFISQNHLSMITTQGVTNFSYPYVLLFTSLDFGRGVTKNPLSSHAEKAFSGVPMTS